MCKKWDQDLCSGGDQGFLKWQKLIGERIKQSANLIKEPIKLPINGHSKKLKVLEACKVWRVGFTLITLNLSIWASAHSIKCQDLDIQQEVSAIKGFRAL